MSSSKRNDIIRLAIAVGLSICGMAAHTVREFGYSGLLALETGMVPVVTVQLLLFMVWWLVPSGRSAAAIALVATAVLQLIGGAILSVLPLPFLPFAPEQTVSHYLSHVFLGLTQIPLLVIPLKVQKGRREHSEARG